MQLIEAFPSNPIVSQFIDRYQYYDFPETTFIKTIPNGKIESWIINFGECQIWDQELEEFQNGQKDTFFPAKNDTSFLKINGKLRCTNIKWKLTALSLSFFKEFFAEWKTLVVEDLFGIEYEKIKTLQFVDGQRLDVASLDRSFEKIITKNKQEHHILKLMQCIESEFPNGFKVEALAQSICVSSKTLERQIKNYFSLSPNALSRILRFSHATTHLKNSESFKYIESLSFGYYDQSHFIKECRQMTGYAPKDFFSKLKLSTTDLLFEDNLDIKPEP